MKSVFRLKGIILICVLLAIPLPTLAIGIGEYGETVIADYMEAAIIDTTYSYGLNCFNSSGQNVAASLFSVSTDTAKSGAQSLKLDTRSQGIGWRSQIIRNISGAMVYGDAVCFEVYVKGYTSKPTGLNLSFNFSDSNGPIKFNSAPYNVVFHYEDADSSGWHRIWATIPYLKSVKSGNVCIQYTKSATDSFTALYFDDVFLRPLPVTMGINNITSNSDLTISLNSIHIKGYDMYNNEKNVVNTGLINWSILSGEASIDSNNNLIYNGASSGNVKIKADFFGITAQTNIQFGTGLNVSVITKSGKSYKANITNTSENTVEVSMFAVLYNGRSLYNVYNSSKSFSAGESADILTPEVNIPKWVKDPVIKVYVWDDIFGMRSYSDVADNFFNFTDDFSYDQAGVYNINGQTLSQNWQKSTFDNGNGYMDNYISSDPDNAQNKAMIIQGGWNTLSGVNFVAPHSGISASKVVQVDIRGSWTPQNGNQQYGLYLMTKTGSNEIANRYQLSCSAGRCSFYKIINYNELASQLSPTIMDMNKWYTFKFILNESKVSWSVSEKGGGFSWAGSFTDTSPFDVSSVQLFVAGQDNPPAYFDNFILRGYDLNLD